MTATVTATDLEKVMGVEKATAKPEAVEGLQVTDYQEEDYREEGCREEMETETETLQAKEKGKAVEEAK